MHSTKRPGRMSRRLLLLYRRWMEEIMFFARDSSRCTAVQWQCLVTRRGGKNQLQNVRVGVVLVVSFKSCVWQESAHIPHPQIYPLV